MSESLPVVGVEQLQVGMFVSLDLPWLDHPFMVNSFRINSPEQLKTLRELGLSKIAFDPTRSTVGPLDPTVAPPPPPVHEVHQEDPAQAELKRQRAARMSCRCPRESKATRSRAASMRRSSSASRPKLQESQCASTTPGSASRIASSALSADLPEM